MKKLDYFLDSAKQILLDDGEVAPIVFGIKSDSELATFPLNFKSDEEKMRILSFVKAVFVHLKIEEYYVVHEAWFVDEDIAEGVPVRDHMSRKEAIVVMYVGRNERCVVQIPFIRNGEVIEFQEESRLYDFEGNFAELLSPIGTKLPETIKSQVVEMIDKKK